MHSWTAGLLPEDHQFREDIWWQGHSGVPAINAYTPSSSSLLILVHRTTFTPGFGFWQVARVAQKGKRCLERIWVWKVGGQDSQFVVVMLGVWYAGNQPRWGLVPGSRLIQHQLPQDRKSANTEEIYVFKDRASELMAQGGRWGSQHRNSAPICWASPLSSLGLPL